MTTLAIRDSRTMFRRQLLHMRRYPSLTLMLVGLPVLLLLLFVFVFGETFAAGIPGLPGVTGRSAYLAYVTPAIVVLAAAAAAQGTAISVAMDKTTGIFARFRTMAISPGSVLAGHVLGSVVQSLAAMGAALGTSILLGYRPQAGPADWLGLLAMLALLAFALTWLCVGLGLAAKTVESASNTPMFLMILPFLSSGFVPTASMPTALAWIAEHQPFTPIIDTIRGLLAGSPDPGTAAIAAVWCVAIALGGYLWSRRLYRGAPSAA